MRDEPIQPNAGEAPEPDLLALLVEALAGNPELSGFEVHYQPIVRLADEAIVGVEAFPRWRHPVAGSIAPSTFVSVAKRAGLSAALDDFVLGRCCADAAALSAVCGREVDLHVNFPGSRLGEPSFESLIDWVLRRHRLRPERLVIELNDTQQRTDLSAAAAAVRRLRERKLRIALDDFGTGLSMLAQLHVLPVDIVKLDAMLATAEPDAWRAEALCLSILSVCEQKSLQVIGEGIQSTTQARVLRQMHCQHGQGSLYGTPLPLQQMTLQQPK